MEFMHTERNIRVDSVDHNLKPKKKGRSMGGLGAKPGTSTQCQRAQQGVGYHTMCHKANCDCWCHPGNTK